MRKTSKTKRKPSAKRPATTSAAQDILSGMRQLVEVLESGRRPADVFPSRSYTIPEPSAWGPDRVRHLRDRLGVAQPVFAKLVGVSTILAQGWEQGRRTPAPVAARLLDTIDRDPMDWLSSLEVAG